MLAALFGLAATVAGSTCDVDQATMLALPPPEFDQVEHQGWRLLSERGCDAAAADLIAAYRAARPGDLRIGTMRWHEGQMRAFAGDYVAARPLFIASINTKPPFNWFGWNDYVLATVAFIDRDRSALLAARARLAATPRPETHTWTDPDGNPIPAPVLAPGEPWPANLPVVDALIRCFERTYKAAYTTPACFADTELKLLPTK